MIKRSSLVQALLASSILLLLVACGPRSQRLAPEDAAEEPGVAAEEKSTLEAPAHGELALEELVSALFDEHGVGDEILANAQTTLELYGVFVQILPPPSERARDLAAERIDSLSARELVLAPARDHFMRHGEPTKLESVIAWKTMEAGRKWTIAIREALGGGDIDEAAARGWLAEFYASLDDDPARQQRIAALRSLEESSGHARRSLELMPALGEQLLDAFSAKLPEPIQPSDEHIGAVKESLDSAMRQPAFEEALFDSYLYATRDISLDELTVVASFYDDGPGEWLLDMLDGANRGTGSAYAGSLARNLADAWDELEGEPDEDEEPPTDIPDGA